MTAKKSPADTSVPRTSTPRIGEEELQWRIAVFRARVGEWYPCFVPGADSRAGKRGILLFF